MFKTIRAIYENGVLRPLVELKLAENSEVVITLETVAEQSSESLGMAERATRTKAESSFQELSKRFEEYRFG